MYDGNRGKLCIFDYHENLTIAGFSPDIAQRHADFIEGKIYEAEFVVLGKDMLGKGTGGNNIQPVGPASKHGQGIDAATHALYVTRAPYLYLKTLAYIDVITASARATWRAITHQLNMREQPFSPNPFEYFAQKAVEHGKRHYTITADPLKTLEELAELPESLQLQHILTRVFGAAPPLLVKLIQDTSFQDILWDAIEKVEGLVDRLDHPGLLIVDVKHARDILFRQQLEARLHERRRLHKYTLDPSRAERYFGIRA